MWTASEFFGVLQTLALGGDALPPPAFAAHVEAMWDYGSYILDPALCMPRNGDADLCNSGYSPVTAAYFKRPDWTWIATRGAQGSPPDTSNGPSSAFPWAGQLALRSGFGPTDTWAFFDVGPYGSSGHAHRDKLHLNLHAKGAMLLVDSGRFAYQGTDLSATLHTQYGPFTLAHNTLTIDGADQLPLPAVATEPIAPSSFAFSQASDWAFGSMSAWNGLAGTATHTRAVFYQRPAGGAADGAGADGDFLVVVDVLTSDRPRALQLTWHAHPNSTGVAVGAAPGLVAVVGGVETRSGQPVAAQACLIPATGAAAFASATVVRGVMKSGNGTHFQGWYSQDYDDAWPAPTLVYDAAAVPGGAVFAWLIVPQSARGPCTDSAAVVSSSASAVVVRVSVGGAEHTVTLPIA